MKIPVAKPRDIRRDLTDEGPVPVCLALGDDVGKTTNSLPPLTPPISHRIKTSRPPTFLNVGFLLNTAWSLMLLTMCTICQGKTFCLAERIKGMDTRSSSPQACMLYVVDFGNAERCLRHGPHHIFLQQGVWG